MYSRSGGKIGSGNTGVKVRNVIDLTRKVQKVTLPVGTFWKWGKVVYLLTAGQITATSSAQLSNYILCDGCPDHEDSNAPSAGASRGQRR